MSEEISEYDKLILVPEEQTAVTPPDDKPAVVETPAGNTSQTEGTVEAGEKTHGEIDDSEKYVASPDDLRKIPFHVLKDALNGKVEAEQKYSNLLAEIEAIKQGQGVANPELPKEALDKLADLAEYDPDGAAILRKTLQETHAAAISASQRAAALERQEIAKQQQSAAQAEAQQQAIIESYPNLKAMQQNPEQWAQAGKIYESFFENPATAQLPDTEKMAKLNDVMSAILGVPAQLQVNAATPTATASKAPPAQIAPQPAQMPYSISDLGSGVIPASSNGQKSIEDMSPFEIQKMVDGMDFETYGKFFG